MKEIKTKLKNMKLSVFMNEDNVLRFLSRLKEISYEIVSDVVDWRDDHSRIHKNQDKEIKKLQKDLKKLEKDVGFLRKNMK